MPESLGRRIARLRNQQGWTQQSLAERIGLSRVAISHFEADLAVPSERTVILLAGLLRTEPQDLVHDTFYPEGKMLRLPPVAPRYTETELTLALYARDRMWLEHAPDQHAVVCATWRKRLSDLYDSCTDLHERGLVRAALENLD